MEVKKPVFICDPTIAGTDDGSNLFVIRDTSKTALLSSKNSDELPFELLAL